jgi:hypothetical protein
MRFRNGKDGHHRLQRYNIVNGFIDHGTLVVCRLGDVSGLIILFLPVSWKVHAACTNPVNKG